MEDDGVGLSFFIQFFYPRENWREKKVKVEADGVGLSFFSHRIFLSSGESGREKRRIRGKMIQLVLSVTPCVLLEGWISFFHQKFSDGGVTHRAGRVALVRDSDSSTFIEEGKSRREGSVGGLRGWWIYCTA